MMWNGASVMVGWKDGVAHRCCYMWLSGESFSAADMIYGRVLTVEIVEVPHGIIQLLNNWAYLRKLFW